MKELQGTGHRAPGTGHRVTVDGDMGGSNVDMCSVGDSCIVDWGEEMGTPRQVGHAFWYAPKPLRFFSNPPPPHLLPIFTKKPPTPFPPPPSGGFFGKVFFLGGGG